MINNMKLQNWKYRNEKNRNLQKGENLPIAYLIVIIMYVNI